ncbi:MAG: hypothetical protein JWN85_1090 [Gammaproteobacteria bacterium]|nr:hypothetical protein [Gammaproteobacteria bacterium]
MLFPRGGRETKLTCGGVLGRKGPWGEGGRAGGEKLAMGENEFAGGGSWRGLCAAIGGVLGYLGTQRWGGAEGVRVFLRQRGVGMNSGWVGLRGPKD